MPSSMVWLHGVKQPSVNFHDWLHSLLNKIIPFFIYFFENRLPILKKGTAGSTSLLMCLVDCVRKVPRENPMTVGKTNKAMHTLDLSVKSPSNSWCTTQSWELCTKIVTFPTFYKKVQIFSFYSEATECQFLLSRLYFEI